MPTTATILPVMPGAYDGATPARERLITTLFLAALFHGIVILGITFAAPELAGGPIPTLQVLLAVDQAPNRELNPEAAYLAQRNQHGAGATDKDVRATSPAVSPLPADWLGVPDGDGVEWRQAQRGGQAVDLVASHSERSDAQVRSGEDRPARTAESPLALLYVPPTPIVAAALDRTLTLRGKLAKEVEVSPDTRESRLAAYLDSWRRKVERVGTVKFPIAARRSVLKANPVLEVLIRADGTLNSIIVRQSSGNIELDQAAIAILKLAAPFDVFPPALHQEYDQLRFAYEWQFVGARISGTVRGAED